VSLNSWPTAGGKALTGIYLLIAVTELPNAGTTLIQPLKFVPPCLGAMSSAKTLQSAMSLTSPSQSAWCIPSACSTRICTKRSSFCLCAASTNRRGSPEENVRALEERAVGLLMKIQDKRLTREFRRYSNGAHGTRDSWRSSVCHTEFPIGGLPHLTALFQI
jgi:hypothetical protein